MALDLVQDPGSPLTNSLPSTDNSYGSSLVAVGGPGQYQGPAQLNSVPQNFNDFLGSIPATRFGSGDIGDPNNVTTVYNNRSFAPVGSFSLGGKTGSTFSSLTGYTQKFDYSGQPSNIFPNPNFGSYGPALDAYGTPLSAYATPKANLNPPISGWGSGPLVNQQGMQASYNIINQMFNGPYLSSQANMLGQDFLRPSTGIQEAGSPLSSYPYDINQNPDLAVKYSNGQINTNQYFAGVQSLNVQRDAGLLGGVFESGTNPFINQNIGTNAFANLFRLNASLGFGPGSFVGSSF